LSTPDEIQITINGSTLDAGFFKPTGAEKIQITVIYCPGFPGNITTSRKISEAFSQKGYSSIYFDYRGIRASEGTLNFIEQVDDLKAIVSYAKDSIKGKVVVVGHGFGGRLAICTTASDLRIDGCIVWECLGDTREELKTITSHVDWKIYSAVWVRDVKGKNNIIEKLRTAADSLNPLECVKKIAPRPVLIIHQKHDPMVKVSNAYELEKTAVEPKTLIIHNGWMHSDEDSFFTSPLRNDGCITLTDNWIKSNILTI
jgi:dienelactone hydrolase